MIVDFLKQADLKLDINNEHIMQNDLEKILQEVGVEYLREHNFDQRNRIDFLVGDVGIECKVAGSSLDVFRQLKRYTSFVKELILYTSKTFRMPDHINGVPVHVIIVRNLDQSESQYIEKGNAATVSISGGRVILDVNDAIVLSKVKKWFNKAKSFKDTKISLPFIPSVAEDILWFGSRYEFEYDNCFDIISDKAVQKEMIQTNLSHILYGKHQYKPVEVKEPYKLRDYQGRFVESTKLSPKILLADDTGLGKSLSGIAAVADHGKLPLLVVCQTHLQKQWEREIHKFTDYTTHIIKKGSDYNIPEVDVYIVTYHKLDFWSTRLEAQSVIFDEVQQFRRGDSTNKGAAGKRVASKSSVVLGLTATPIYNYGDEIYNVLTIINENAFEGMSFWEFYDVWCTYDGNRARINDPKALGQFIRERGWMVRRTRKDVSMELDPVNNVYKEVQCDYKEFKRYAKRLKELSVDYLTIEEFTQKGMIARELNNIARMATGVAKAVSVADEVKNICDAGEKVLLVGWHRDVYEVWLDRLKEYNPVLFTGSESSSKKDKSISKFISDDSCQVMIMSLRSGEGVNGLQDVCSHVVFGEFDWSPQVHHQIVSRLARDGQENIVNAIYCSMDSGVDPVMMDVLGIKMCQSDGVINPDLNTIEKNDYVKLKELAERLKDLK